MHMLIATRSRRAQIIAALVVFSVGIAMLIATGRPARAANGVNITVNDTADALADPSHCGNPNPDCKLRDAIGIANNDTNDIIHLPAIPANTPTVYKLIHANGPFSPTAGMTIAGDDPRLVAVDGNGTDTVFHVVSPQPVTITGITIQNGSAFVGAGVYNQRSTITLGNDIVTNNVADDEGGGRGGGLANETGIVTIQATTFSNNKALEGGNATNGSGGGIYNFNDSSAGSPLTLVNDTFNGNTAALGGAIHTSNPASLNNVTIVGNTAGPPTGAPGGAGIYDSNSSIAAQVTLHNTIVAKNTVGDCGPNPTRFVSTGHNIDSDNSCNLAAAGDQPNKDPQVQALAFNAPPVSPPNGYPNTMAIGPGSPALDTADNNNCPTADERGTNRPQNLVCDIGAFEFVPPAAAAAPGLPPSGAWTTPGQALDVRWLAAALLAIGALGALGLVRRQG